MRKSLKLSVISLLASVLMSLVLFSCAVNGQKQQAEEPVRPSLSPAEQDAKALELFMSISEIFDQSSRQEALPKVEALYLKIINDYPDAALGQECYWRLIIIYVRDTNPPQFEKAETYYGRFIKKYPDSQFRREIEDVMSKAYFASGKWENILAFYSPAVERYIKTGKLDRPQDMFLYAEAKLNLGDLTESEKGYRIVISLFPKSRESSISKQRLVEIEKKKKEKGGI